MSDPKVSILIPFYNSESFLAETIRSALSQTWKNKEIILVDDGSTDKSGEIARSFESEIVSIFHIPHSGASAARNHAFSHSSGDFIQYLDGDDILSENKILNQLNEIMLKGNPSTSLITSPTARFSGKIENCEILSSPVLKDYDQPFELIRDMFITRSFISSHAYLTPRNLVEKSRGWDESLTANDDGDFFARIIALSGKILFCHNTLVYYRNVENSLSKKKDEIHSDSEMRSLIKICTLLLNSDNSEENREACSSVLNWFIAEWFPGNRAGLKELSRFMKNNSIKYQTASESNSYRLLVKFLGWRTAFILSSGLSALKRI